MKNQSPSRKKAGGKLSTSLIVGMLLVPVSAVAAVALVNPDAAAESEDTAAVEVVAETSTTTTLADIVVPEIASEDDLALACGEQGLGLVTKETDGTISPLEQAALDSLRAICLSEDIELPGPPAPDAVVETVTVVASPPPASDSGADATADDAAAEFEAAYAATVAHINKAIDEGAGGEKIAKAEQLVAEAAGLADGGDYAGGMAKLADARKAADDADRSHHDDDDDDDHDEEDEDDEEDEEDEDDEDDEDDE